MKNSELYDALCAVNREVDHVAIIVTRCGGDNEVGAIGLAGLEHLEILIKGLRTRAEMNPMEVAEYGAGKGYDQ